MQKALQFNAKLQSEWMLIPSLCSSAEIPAEILPEMERYLMR